MKEHKIGIYFLRISAYLEDKHGNQHPQITKKKVIDHISTVLYSWREHEESTASGNTDDVKPYALVAQKKAIENDLKRREIKGVC